VLLRRTYSPNNVNRYINLPAADPEENDSWLHETKCQRAWQDHGLEYDSSLTEHAVNRITQKE
jgi:hypothetical protein